MAIVFC